MHYKFENKIGGWSKESYTWHEYEWGSEYMRQAQCVVPFRSIYVKQENKNKDWRKEMEEQRVCREEWMDQNRERDPMSLSIVSPCLSLTSLLVNIKPNIQQTTIIPSLPSISINNISLLPPSLHFWSHLHHSTNPKTSTFYTVLLWTKSLFLFVPKKFNLITNSDAY